MAGDGPGLTRSHWYWRPGWRIGRRHYTWHVTFTERDADGLLPVLQHYRPLIDTLTHLEPLPFAGLHLTTQGVGFTDEIDAAALPEIIERTSERLAALHPIDAVLGPAAIDAEGLFLTVHPDAALQSLRTCLRAAIANTWGAEAVPEGESFVPHVTLAYSDGVVSLERAREAVALFPAATARVRITDVALIELHRDHRRYDWTELVRVQLGCP